MNEEMKFPETFEQFAREYGFKDSEEVYTNGSDLIQIFRVKQWLEHQMTDDSISRQEVLEQTYKWSKDEFLRVAKPFDYLRKRINSLLPVNPQQKTGHWIKFKKFENGYYRIKCSECGQYWSIDGHAKIAKYCFNCGAKMVEPQESEDKG